MCQISTLARYLYNYKCSSLIYCNKNVTDNDSVVNEIINYLFNLLTI